MSKFNIGDEVAPVNYPMKKLPCTISEIHEHKVYDNGVYSYSTFIYRLKEWSFEKWFSYRDLVLVKNA